MERRDNKLNKYRTLIVQQNRAPVAIVGAFSVNGQSWEKSQLQIPKLLTIERALHTASLWTKSYISYPDYNKFWNFI